MVLAGAAALWGSPACVAPPYCPPTSRQPQLISRQAPTSCSSPPVLRLSEKGQNWPESSWPAVMMLLLSADRKIAPQAR